MFQSLRKKILLVVAICASITLVGFFALYWITLKQNRSLEQHLDSPAISIKWFTLNNAIHRASRVQMAWLESFDEIFLEERDLIWINNIYPKFEELMTLYKKSRIWEVNRSVERRVFYDLRLMILEFENIQKKVAIYRKNNGLEQTMDKWTSEEWPMVLKISQQIEIMVRWQSDFAKQQATEIQRGFYWLGIMIWIVASIVLILVLIIAIFFAKRISAPLRKLRSNIQQFINEQDHEIAIPYFKSNESLKNFLENEDEIQKLTEVFEVMEQVIRERTKLLESSNFQLNEANRAKGIYLTNMSHELRTPLNSIIGFTEVLLESPGQEKLSSIQIDRLNRILKSGRHLLELINSLLDLSKIEVGQIDMDLTHFHLENLLQDVMESLEPLLEEKSLQHEVVYLSDKPIMIYSDSAKLRQVLINLLANSIKYTDSRGQIKISCNNDLNGVSIQIKDSGCGITEAEHQQIFEMFYQVNPSGTPKGTGLGLALVKSLMELLGGSVSLKSKFGEGSMFTLFLPSSSIIKKNHED